MHLQTEIEQLDDAVRTQARSQDELTRRLEQLERRLARLEPDADSSGGNEQADPSQMDTDQHG
jgi:type II secretory pathway component PulJ